MSDELLYHYTCGHSAKSLRRSMRLEPNEHPLLAGMKLVWLTDLGEPHIEALGLTSHILKCRRTEYRATVESSELVMPWHDLARKLRQTFGSEAAVRGVRALESAPGVLPMHWWVSFWPVPVLSLEPVP